MVIHMDLSEYWKNRGPGYYSELKTQSRLSNKRLQEQQDYVIKLIQHFGSRKILEIGCGTGRYTKILYSLFKPEKYIAIDISKEQIESAREYVSGEDIEFTCSSVQDYNSDEKFDLVFASEILMHISTNDIAKVVSKIMSYSTKKIISIDWFDKNSIGRELGGYCFIHDYRDLFKNNGAKNVQIHELPLLPALKWINAYARLRGRHGVEKQAIIEVDV